MGSAEVRNLKYGDFLESIKEYFKPLQKECFDIHLIIEKLEKHKGVIPVWKIERYKTGMPYITFSTPESLEALLKFMNWRIQNKYPFKSFDDWIFLSDGKKANGDTLATYFKRLNEKAGFGHLEHSVFFHSHALRKFFGSTLHKKGIQRLNYDFMMGHRVDQNAEAYIKPNVDSLKREYIRCLEDLSIENVEIRRIASEEVKHIVNELNEKDEEIKKQRKELDEIKSKIAGLSDLAKVIDNPKVKKVIKEEVDDF